MRNAYGSKSEALDDATPHRIISGYTNIGKTPEEVSKVLHENGIKGIRYLDEGSRSTGKGTSNFVVFDPSTVKILEKNGVPTRKEILEQALDDKMTIAQKNAALPISEGGLGLHPNNTPQERAKVLGFDTENMWFRGDKPNLTEFNPNDPSNYIKGNIFLTDKKRIAAWYAKNGKKDIMNMPSNENEGVYSLFAKNNPKELKIDANENSWVDIPVPKAWKKSFYDGTGQIDDVALMANQKKYPSMQVNNVIDQYGLGNQKVIFNPSDIRSVNAAFDPKKKNSPDLLAGALAVPMVMPEDKPKTRKQIIEEQMNKKRVE